MLDPFTAHLFAYILLAGLAFSLFALLHTLTFDSASHERLERMKLRRGLHHSDIGAVLANLGIPLSSYVANHSSGDLRHQLEQCRRCAMKLSCHHARLRAEISVPIPACPNRTEIEQQLLRQAA